MLLSRFGEVKRNLVPYRDVCPGMFVSHTRIYGCATSQPRGVLSDIHREEQSQLRAHCGAASQDNGPA